MCITSVWLCLLMASTFCAVCPGSRPCKRLAFREMATNTQNTILVVVGQGVELSCEVETRPKDFSIRWHRDSRGLCHGKRVRIKRRGQYLKISSAIRGDTGNYTCEVVDNDLSCGGKPRTLKKTFHLTVTAAATKFSTTKEVARPTFSMDTTRRFIAMPVGSSAKLDCSTEGTPPLSVQWSKDGLPASKRYKRFPQFLLKIGNAVPSDAGNYTCNVSNEYGWTEHTYQLHVKERLRAKPVVLPLANVTAWVGETVEILCWALSDGLPHFKWLQWLPSHVSTPRKYRVLGEGSGEVEIEPTVMRSGAFEFVGVKLLLRNVTTGQQGRYSCVAGNALGFTVKDVQVTVLERKGPNDCFGAADGYYPHVGECSKFVVCRDSVTVEKICPSGLLWNRRHNFCDLPKNVSCK